jgi:hypothetical protein
MRLSRGNDMQARKRLENGASIFFMGIKIVNQAYRYVNCVLAGQKWRRVYPCRPAKAVLS